MAALQKFKILATPCGVVQSPTRCPRTSPLAQLPRKMTTLRMLLTKNTSRHSQKLLSSQQEVVVLVDHEHDVLDERKKKKSQSNTLKGLFVSSFEDDNVGNVKAGDDDDDDDVKVRDKSEILLMKKLQGGLGGEPGLSRPVWVGFRHRLLRKAWRPLLVSIPE